MIRVRNVGIAIEANYQTNFWICARLPSKIHALHVETGSVLCVWFACFIAPNFGPILRYFGKLLICTVLKWHLRERVIKIFTVTFRLLAKYLLPSSKTALALVNEVIVKHCYFKIVVTEVARFSIDSLDQLLIEDLVLPRPIVERNAQLDRIEEHKRVHDDRDKRAQVSRDRCLTFKCQLWHVPKHV